MKTNISEIKVNKMKAIMIDGSSKEYETLVLGSFGLISLTPKRHIVISVLTGKVYGRYNRLSNAWQSLINLDERQKVLKKKENNPILRLLSKWF